MSSQAVARFEARTLLRHFLRLRYEFPSKQVRSILRRRIVSFFQIHQVEYEHMISKNGLDAANHRASVWRKEAAQDLEVWRKLAKSDENTKRHLTNEIRESTPH